MSLYESFWVAPSKTSAGARRRAHAKAAAEKERAETVEGLRRRSARTADDLRSAQHNMGR